MEALRCADGNYVSRTGPHCEFTPCPKEPAAVPPPGGPVCDKPPLRCPDGKLIVPDAACHYAPCLVTLMGPPHAVETGNGIADLPDYPLVMLSIVPIKTVQYVIEHRSAFDGQQVVVRGIVVSETSRPCLSQLKSCIRHITLADTNILDRDMHYDLRVDLAPGNTVPYTSGQIADVTGIVAGSKTAVRIRE